MRKILSLLMMALFSVSMFAATDTLYVWDGNGSTTAVIQKGGTAEAIQTSGTNIVAGASQKGNWCFKVNKGFTNGEYYIGIALEEGVNAGDEIDIAFFRTSSKSTYVLGMDFSADKASVATTYQILSKGDPQVLESNGTPADSTFVVPDGVKNAKYIRIYRNSGSTGLYVSKFVVKRESSEPEPTTKTIYLNTGGSSLWNQANAVFFEHSWGAEDSDLKLTQVEGDLYKAEIPVGNSSIVFVRMPAGSESIIWDGDGKYWNKTGDLTIPNDKDLYTITGWGETDGAWSTYSPSEPPAPTEPDSIYFVNVPGWENLRVHLWGGTASGTEWPGVEMTKLGENDKINGYDVYKYVADEGAYANCIFSDNGQNQTDDLTWTSGKYYYDGAWYAKENIPAPAVPLEGNIWKVVETTPVIAGSHYIDEALLKMDGVYATTLRTNARTIAGEEFTHAIQVRTNSYPTQDNLVGPEKEGSTSLVITAKEDIDVTLYYNRQAVDEGGTENDNKDLIVFDQAAITTKLTGVFTIAEILEGGSYLNATKKLALKKGHVYTVTASGTTLQLHGLKFEEHIPNMEIAGQWDVKEDESWVVNHMTLADDAKTASYEVELTKGDYEFKLIKDGAWLTKQNDGAYGLHREWPGVAGVKDDAANNLKVTADADGIYIFTWTFENDSIGIDFPAPEIPAKFYITGEAKLVGGDGWQANDIKVTEDSYTFENLAAGDYAFKITTDGTWSTTKGYDALTAYTKGLFRGTGSGDDNIRFILKEAGNVTVTYTDEVFKVEASVEFDLPSVKIVGDLVGTWSGDEAVALTPAADGLTASLTHSLEMNDNHGYSLKMIVAGSWLSLLGEGGQSYGLHSEHTTAANIYYDDENSPALWLTITEAGNYQFIWEYATNSLTVIFPSPATAIDNAEAAGKAIKMIEHGQLFILRDGKTYTVQGMMVK